jgi:putative hydrolase of the HAD superfamily
MPAPRPAAIFLDALGTVVALEPPAPRLRAELAQRFGFEVSEAEAAGALAAEIAYYRAHLDEGRDDAGLESLRRRCAEVLCAALPGDGARLEVDPLVEALLASLHFTAFPDALPALQSARQRGQRLVVVSNWDVSLVGVLRRLELEPLLDGIVTSAGAGARKPSPAIFERALELAGVPPGDTIHVGDTLDEDVAGARAAGIEPILIRRGDGPPVPGVRTISSLSELAAPPAG